MPATEGKSKFARLALVIALVLGAGVVTFTAFQLDDSIRNRIVAAQGKGWKKSESYRMQGAVSRYGDWPFLMLLGGAGLLVAWRLRNQRWQRILIAAMVASTLAGALVNAVRLTTGRPRPRESPKIEQGWYGPYHNGRLLIGDARYNSFPSGHTATAVGFAGVILFASPLAGAAAMVVALAIAWSRIILGAHHPSDIVVATLVALAIAWFAWRVAVRHGDSIAAWVAAKIRHRP
jgi:membrane-associated phospholipid phosphatase